MKKLIVIIALALLLGIIPTYLQHRAMGNKSYNYSAIELDIKADQILNEPKIDAPMPRKKIQFTDGEKTKVKLYDLPLDDDLQKYTIAKSEEAGLDPKLVLAVMKVESNFKSDLISKTNDYGLMQINKVNHKWLKKELGITDFLDAKQSIACGIYMLADISSRYTDEHRILTAYNWGEYGKFKTWTKRKNPTSKYSQKVLKIKKDIRQIGG